MSCCAKSVLPEGTQGGTGPAGPQGPQGATGAPSPTEFIRLTQNVVLTRGSVTAIPAGGWAVVDSSGAFSYSNPTISGLVADDVYEATLTFEFQDEVSNSTSHAWQGIETALPTILSATSGLSLSAGANLNYFQSATCSFVSSGSTTLDLTNLSVLYTTTSAVIPNPAQRLDLVITRLPQVGEAGPQGPQGTQGPQGVTPVEVRAIARYNIDPTGSVGPAGGLAFDPTTTVPGPFNVTWSAAPIGLGLAEPFEDDPSNYFTLTGDVVTFNQTGLYQLTTGMAILSTEVLAPVGAQILYNSQSIFAAAPGCGSFSNDISLAGSPVAGLYPYAYSLSCDTTCSITAGDTVSIVLYAGGGAGGVSSEIAMASNWCIQFLSGPSLGPTGAQGPQGVAGTAGATGPQGPQGVVGPTGSAAVNQVAEIEDFLGGNNNTTTQLSFNGGIVTSLPATYCSTAPLQLYNLNSGASAGNQSVVRAVYVNAQTLWPTNGVLGLNHTYTGPVNVNQTDTFALGRANISPLSASSRFPCHFSLDSLSGADAFIRGSVQFGFINQFPIGGLPAATVLNTMQPGSFAGLICASDLLPNNATLLSTPGGGCYISVPFFSFQNIIYKDQSSNMFQAFVTSESGGVRTYTSENTYEAIPTVDASTNAFYSMEIQFTPTTVEFSVYSANSTILYNATTAILPGYNVSAYSFYFIHGMYKTVSGKTQNVLLDYFNFYRTDGTGTPRRLYF